jgi:hypothetical protein
MPGMTIGISQSDGPLRGFGKMTVLAGIPGRDTAVGLSCGSLGPFDDVGNEHLVLFEHVHMMAFLAGEVPVLAQLPGLKRLLHHVALCAKFGVFLCICIIPEADYSPHNRKQQQEKHDRLLVFLDKAHAE